MTSSAEDEINLQNTDAWIKSKPLSVSLRRRILEDDGAGGRHEAQDSPRILEPQTFRLTETRGATTFDITTPQGSQVPKNFLLVGYPDSDIQEDDTFVYHGGEFKVDYVKVDHFSRTAAEVSYVG